MIIWHNDSPHQVGTMDIYKEFLVNNGRQIQFVILLTGGNQLFVDISNPERNR
jgi:hypothetical protein